MPGIIEGERDSLTGEFIKPIKTDNSIEDVEVATVKDFKNYNPNLPFQKINHYKAVLNNHFIIGSGNIKATLGFQQNKRKEYANIIEPTAYGLYFLLNTVNYDLRYVFPEKNQFNTAIGINGMQQISKNKGTEFLIPEYNLFDIGVFLIMKKSFNKLDVNGGLRFDVRTQHSKNLFLNADGVKTDNPDSTSYQQFKAFDATFSGISASLGATYQFTENAFAKVNIARGYRAPNISELGSNGEHEGTTRYEIGDSKLKPENSLQMDASFGINTTHLTAEIDIFNNSIDHFIFMQKLNSINGGDSLTAGYSTFKFVSGNTNLSGGEITVDIHPHPLDWLHIENSFSYVQAVQKNQPDSLKYLPFTPAPKLQSEVRADIKKIGKIMSNAFLKVEMENYFEQRQFHAAFKTETKTPHYTLVNLGAGASIVFKKQTRCTIYISINNLTDVSYQSHLSRLKYAAVNNATGRVGVYNMGRNFNLKLIIPLNIKK